MAGQTSSTKFKPGQSGNPDGRPPKEWTIKGLIKEALERKDTNGISDKQYVYQKLVDLAKNGDVAALKEMNNRLEGLPTAKVEGSLEVKNYVWQNGNNPVLPNATSTDDPQQSK